VGRQNPTHNSKVGTVETAGMAVDIAGSASHGDRSTDQFVADTLDTAATANNADIANTADTEHPRKDRSRGHMPVPEDRGHPGQAKSAA
jgi:hypothetical protein